MELRHFRQINSQELDENILQAKANAVVKLCSSWSGSSHLLGYSLSAFQESYRGKVDFYQVDIDAEPNVGEAYRVELIPTLLFFKGGKLVDILSGLIPRTIISSKIELLLNH